MINFRSAVKISFRALRINKMRSALTLLGIIIGVGAVIAMIALGSGASKKISEQIAKMGSNLLIVVPGATTAGGVRLGAGTQSTLSINDAEAIARECPAVLAVAPGYSRVAQVIYGSQNWSTAILGTTPNILVVRDWTLSEGRAFSDEETRNASKVCMLGQTVVERLFGDASPIGQIIRISNIPFTVIGVLEAKGQSPTGSDQDDTVMVPITVAQKRLFGTAFPGMIGVVMVKAVGPDELGPAQAQITALLKQRHRIAQGQDDDFTVRNLSQLMDTAKKSSQTMTFLLGAIASVSLLVGGIGIMNIMLVSVTERTREIGIRMAVGARTWDIRTQFLVESIILSLMGGIIGIGFGVGGSVALSTFTGWPTSVSVSSVLLAFGFSGFVGIFFGFYPAWKASLLNPIEALRYE